MALTHTREGPIEGSAGEPLLEEVGLWNRTAWAMQTERSSLGLADDLSPKAGATA